MLKVALVNDAFLPIIDGVGRVVYEYATAIGSRGNECYVIAPMCEAGYRARYPFEIIDFQSVLLPGRAHYRTGVATLDPHYMSRISSLKVDLIHAHSPGPAGMEAVRLASKLRVPLVGTFHSKFYDDFLKATHSKSLATLGVRYVVDFFDRCDEVWTVSATAADTLREYGYKGRIEIVQNGVNTEYSNIDESKGRRMARQAFGLSEAPMLLYVGQMNWKKNIRRIIEAARILYEKGQPFQLVFTGKGPDEDEIKEVAYAKLPKEQLRFTGHVTDNYMLAGLYLTADVFVFPSEYDTAGMVVREAATVGTPSIVLRGSAPAEVIVDGENGFICKNSALSLSESIEQALRDPQRLQRIGKQAKLTIPKGWDNIMDEVLGRYQTLVEREKGALTRKRGIFRHELTAIDHTLEKRTAELVWRYLKQDMQHIYAYDYTPQKTAPSLAQESTLLPRSTPEKQGISSENLLELYRAVDTDEDANVHSMLVLRNGHVVSEGYWAPYIKEAPHQLYSMSKSITATAIGLLVDEGMLTLDERIVDIFADKVTNKAEHPQRNITVWHLLTMSTGVRFDEVGSALGKDWEQEFLDSSLRFEPGTQFYYNSMNTYMLAAIVCRRTGGSMMNYLTPRLFAPLGICSASWELCPNGVEKGGWGLSLTLEDAAKVGLLYLQKGRFMVDGKRKQLLSREWVEAATKRQIATPNGELRYGYGYQIWMAPNKSGYMFNGAFGQYLVIMPDKNALVTIFSGSSRLFAQGDLMSYISQCFLSVSGPLEENPRTQRLLKNALSMLSVTKRKQGFLPALLPIPFAELADFLHGNRYNMAHNTTGAFPVVLEAVHNNFSTGLTAVSFEKSGAHALLMHVDEAETRNTIEIRANGFSHSEVKRRQEFYSVAISATYGARASGSIVLQLYLYFLETPCARILTLDFSENKLSMICDENPSIQSAATMLMELAGVTQVELFRSVLPLLRGEKLRNRLQTFTTATLHGLLQHDEPASPQAVQ